MIELAQARARSSAILDLAQRLAQSENHAILDAQAWLVQRGQLAPERYAHHGEMPALPGVRTKAEMTALAASTGPMFERLFLDGMIAHHRGVLTMIDDLAHVPGALKDAEVSALVSAFARQQRAEVEWMMTTARER